RFEAGKRRCIWTKTIQKPPTLGTAFGHLDLEHLAALSRKVTKRSLGAWRQDDFSLPYGRIVTVLEKDMSSRQKNRASPTHKNLGQAPSRPAYRGRCLRFREKD